MLNKVVLRRLGDLALRGLDRLLGIEVLGEV
jgi:hypothetical protein